MAWRCICCICYVESWCLSTHRKLKTSTLSANDRSSLWLPHFAHPSSILQKRKCESDGGCQVSWRRRLSVTVECAEVIGHIRRMQCVLWCIATWCDGRYSVCHYSGHALGLAYMFGVKQHYRCSEFNIEFVWRQSTECQRVRILRCIYGRYGVYCR